MLSESESSSELPVTCPHVSLTCSDGSREVWNKADITPFSSYHLLSIKTGPDKGVLARAISVWHQVDADMAKFLAEKNGISSYETDITKMRVSFMPKSIVKGEC